MAVKLKQMRLRIHCFHMIQLLFFLMGMIPLRSQPVMQSETLTPTNLNANGASVNTHTTEVSVINDVWSVQILSQSSWQFIIILDNSWGFDPAAFSSIKLTVDSPTTITDKIVFGFTSNNEEYFSMSIPMTSNAGDTNQIYPSCDSTTNPTQTYGVGDIASIPDFDRSCDIAGGSCTNWRTMLPQNTQSNQFPLTITLENSPSTNSMFVKTDTTNNGHIQICPFVSFLTNRGLKIYVGGNDPLQTFEISSFTIESYAESLPPTTSPTTAAPTAAPSAAPTLAPTTAPTNAPTKAPSATPTNAPSNAPTATPTMAPSIAPSSSPTHAPSAFPTKPPSSAPSTSPTKAPTVSPVVAPTNAPTYSPSAAPTQLPTGTPTSAPTETPTAAPTDDPTMDPTKDPTSDPTYDPTKDPTMIPTNYPSKEPTTHLPTTQPTMDPTDNPSTDPTPRPTFSPVVMTTEDLVQLAASSSDPNVGIIVAVCILSLVIIGLLKVAYDHHKKRQRIKYSEGDAMLDAIQGVPIVEVEGAPINSWIVTVCFIGKTFHYQLPNDTGAGKLWNDATYNKLIHVVGNEFNLHHKFALFEHVNGVKIDVDCIDDIINAFESNNKRQIILYVEVEHMSSVSSKPTPGKTICRVASTSVFQSKSSVNRTKYTMSLNLDAPTSESGNHSSDSSEASHDFIIKKTRQ